MEDQAAQKEMPRYECHKIVHALKIAAVEFDATKASNEKRETDGSATITPAEEGFAPFKVDGQYVRKHLLSGKTIPDIIGGYYVVYEDGYRSWSPGKAFENGYTRVY